MENESILFRAELYNESYEPVNDAEVEIAIRNEEGNEFPFVFSPLGSNYRLDAGVLPVGRYTFLARVERNGKTLTDEGSFSVKSFALEGADLRANHDILYALSENSGGALYYPSNFEELSEKLLSEENRFKPVSYSTEILSSLLNFKWIFFLLLGLLSAEWFLRKRAGTY